MKENIKRLNKKLISFIVLMICLIFSFSLTVSAYGPIIDGYDDDRYDYRCTHQKDR